MSDRKWKVGDIVKYRGDETVGIAIVLGLAIEFGSQSSGPQNIAVNWLFHPNESYIFREMHPRFDYDAGDAPDFELLWRDE